MIEIREENDLIYVISPFHPEFSEKALGVGGVWRDQKWCFPTRNKELVDALLIELFGMSNRPVELSKIIVHYSLLNNYPSRYGENYYICGRQVVSLPFQFNKIIYGKNVVKLSGSCWVGGSRRNPCIEFSDDCSFEIEDIPLHFALRIKNTLPPEKQSLLNIVSKSDLKIKNLLEKKVRLESELSQTIDLLNFAIADLDKKI